MRWLLPNPFYDGRRFGGSGEVANSRGESPPVFDEENALRDRDAILQSQKSHDSQYFIGLSGACRVRTPHGLPMINGGYPWQPRSISVPRLSRS